MIGQQLMGRINLLLLLIGLQACVKDDDATVSCADQQDDIVLIDGRLFHRRSVGAMGCYTSTQNGSSQLTHFRGLAFESVTDSLYPNMTMVLNSTPPAGQVSIYQLESRYPLLNNPPPIAGKATLRFENYRNAEGQMEVWYSNDQSGYIEVLSDSSGGVVFNFEVSLIKDLERPELMKAFCGKNIICE